MTIHLLQLKSVRARTNTSWFTQIPYPEIARFMRANLRSIIIWPVAFVLLSGVLCISLFIKLEADKKNLQTNGLKEVTLLSRAYAQQLTQTIEDLDQLLMVISNYWEQSKGTFRFEDMKKSGAFTAKQFTAVTIFDQNGIPVTSTVPLHTIPTIKDQPYFEFHKNNNSDAMRINTPTVTQTTGKWAIHLSRRLSRPNDEFDGILVLAIEPEYFAGFMDAFALHETGLLAIVGNDGAVHVTRVGSRIEQGEKAASLKIPVSELGESAGLIQNEAWFSDNKARFVAAHPLKSYPLIAMAGLEQKEVLRSYEHSRALYEQVAIGGILALALSAAALTWMSIRMAWKHYTTEGIRETYRAATEGANEGFYMWEPILEEGREVSDFRLVDCNERGAALYGLPKSGLLGARLSTLYDATYFSELMEIGRTVMQTGFYEDDHEVLNSRLVTARWLYRKFVRSGSRIAVTLRDITEKKVHEHEMLRLATQDVLTGLPNRYWLMTFLPDAMKRALANKTQLAILFIDLDDFKKVNDSSGHSAGDNLLQAVAVRIRGILRPTDTVARLGGDEFTVVIESTDHDNEIAEVAHRVATALQQPFQIDAHRSATVGGSIGIALYPRDGTDADTLLKGADIAMYAAKTENKGAYRFYNQQLYESVKQRLDIEYQLLRAIEQDQFVMHYQPRVDATSGRLVGMETLVRWIHPDRGLISPGEFIPVAESTGAIVPLGELVMKKVCAQLAAWKTQGVPLVPVSINVSARQFNEGKVKQLIITCLGKYALSPSLIELELTESAMMGNLSAVSKEINEINALGVKIHIDDFGTGYSSLSLLNNLDMDVLKVDRAFTSQLGKGDEGEIFFKAIVSMANALGMRVVAEGVETMEQLHILQALSCDEIQGYLFSPPATAEEILPFLYTGFLMPKVA